MKNKLAITLGTSLLCVQAFAINWVGNAYVSLDVNGGGELSYDLYNDGGATQHNADPSGSQSGTAFHGTTININFGESILLGGSIWSNEGNGSNDPWGADNATLAYAVGASAASTFASGYTDVNLPFATNPSGTDDRWDSNGGTAGIGAATEIGSGLTAGTYILSLYISADDTNAAFELFNYRNSSTGNGAFSSNPAANNFSPYTATIIVAPLAGTAAPEPSSIGLLGLGAMLLRRSVRKHTSL